MSGESEGARDHFWNDVFSMVDFLEEQACCGEFEQMPERERRLLKYGAVHLRGAVEAVVEGLRQLPDERRRSLEQRDMKVAIYAAFLVGRFSDATESAIKFAKDERASEARKARAESPSELALIDAIVAERGGGAAERPAKEATAILGAVNIRLKKSGFGSVKIDVIRRRLEKFPLS